MQNAALGQATHDRALVEVHVDGRGFLHRHGNLLWAGVQLQMISLQHADCTASLAKLPLHMESSISSSPAHAPGGITLDAHWENLH